MCKVLKFTVMVYFIQCVIHIGQLLKMFNLSFPVKFVCPMRSTYYKHQKQRSKCKRWPPVFGYCGNIRILGLPYLQVGILPFKGAPSAFAHDAQHFCCWEHLWNPICWCCPTPHVIKLGSPSCPRICVITRSTAFVCCCDLRKEFYIISGLVLNVHAHRNFWFQASAAILMISALLRDITGRRVAIIYLHFGKMYRSHL
jgi:hypothetical protein